MAGEPQAEAAKEREVVNPLRKFRERIAAEKAALYLRMPALAARLDVTVDDERKRPADMSGSDQSEVGRL